MRVRRIGRLTAVFSVTITTFVVLIIGGLWIASEITSFQRAAQTDAQDLLDSHRESIRNRVGDVVDFFEAEIVTMEMERRMMLRRRVDTAATVVREIQSRSPGQPFPDTLEALKVFILSPEGVLLFGSSIADGVELRDVPVPRIDGYLAWEEGNATTLVAYDPELNILVGATDFDQRFEELVRLRLRKILEKIPIESDEYLFGATYEGVSILGPRIGENMWDAVDSNGIHVVRSLSQIAQAGGGYLTYHLPATTGLEPIPKTSYVQGIDRLGWYIGIGFNRDTAAKTSQRRHEAIVALLWSRLVVIVSALVLLLAFVVASSIWSARMLISNVGRFTDFAAHAAKDRRLIDENRVVFQEFRELAVAINEMVETLRTAIDEKNILLREVHHRVKNNMQIISSLLSLQEEEGAGGSYEEVFVQVRNRVGAMALVHEQLYQAETLSVLAVRPYLEDLVVHVLRSYERLEAGWRVTVECDDINLNLDRSIPLGLIVTELVSNALKYAESPSPELHVSVRGGNEADERLELVVRDNGPGIPPLDQIPGRGLGLTLVEGLVSQLGGEITVSREGGTRWVVRFSP